MNDFFRFPQTPHLTWLGPGTPRGDKLLSPQDAKTLLDGEVTIEEKVDGANLGISVGPDGRLRAQNRGQYLQTPFTGQFSRLQGWLSEHGHDLIDRLEPSLILFGEWCTAKHSLGYDRLPDWFLLFDVLDRSKGRFWSTVRRDRLVEDLGLTTVPLLLRGRSTPTELQALLETRESRFRPGPLEGVIIRREDADWCQARAKLVRAEFTQAIGDHWRGRSIEWNRMQTT